MVTMEKEQCEWTDNYKVACYWRSACVCPAPLARDAAGTTCSLLWGTAALAESSCTNASFFLVPPRADRHPTVCRRQPSTPVDHHNDRHHATRGGPVALAQGRRLCHLLIWRILGHGFGQRAYRGPAKRRESLRGPGRRRRPPCLGCRWCVALVAFSVVHTVMTDGVVRLGTRERHLESVLQQALRQILLVKQYPRCLIQIVLQITAAPANEYVNTKLIQPTAVRLLGPQPCPLLNGPYETLLTLPGRTCPSSQLCFKPPFWPCYPLLFR